MQIALCLIIAIPMLYVCGHGFQNGLDLATLAGTKEFGAGFLTLIKGLALYAASLLAACVALEALAGSWLMLLLCYLYVAVWTYVYRKEYRKELLGFYGALKTHRLGRDSDASGKE